VATGLKDVDDPRIAASDDISAVSQFITKLSAERARVTALLESSVQELFNQKSALEEATHRELEIGQTIQRSLLQGTLPGSVEGAWVACFTEPSQGIDGDFYSFRHYHPTCFEVLVGDVMGKGVPAALIGAAIKTAYNEALVDLLAARVGTRGLPTPADIVNRLHQMLTPRLMSLSSFATLALYRFDLEAGLLTYVHAGHPPGLLTHASDMRIESIYGENLPIGVVPQETYIESTIPIAPGDSLLLYSDGITEARNPDNEEFGLDRLSVFAQAGREAGLPLTSILQSIRGELRRFTGNDQLIDDQTALMVELRPRRRPPRAHLGDRLNPVVFELPWSLEALATLRLEIQGAILRLTSEDAEALILATHEAASNIIRHSRPAISEPTLVCRVRYLGTDLIVELIYPGELFSPPAHKQADFSGGSDGGFGLYIIEKSVDEVEYLSPVRGMCITRLVKRTGSRVDNADELR
jgi:phosphoserine phosphatase RsbU/P